MVDGDADAASEALAVWRGDPLAGFADEPWARSSVAELHERRHEVLLVDIDARLGTVSTPRWCPRFGR